MSFWLGTIIFALVQIIVSACIHVFSSKASKGLNHVMGLTAGFQLWMMWGIIYLAQLNPLIVPEFSG